jgi:hypothetical protein
MQCVSDDPDDRKGRVLGYGNWFKHPAVFQVKSCRNLRALRICRSIREDSLCVLAQDGITLETDRALGMDHVADLLPLWTRERVRHIRLCQKFQSVMGYVQSELVPRPRNFSKLCLGLFAKLSTNLPTNLSTLLYEPHNCTLAISGIEPVDKHVLQKMVKWEYAIGSW